MVIWSSLSRRLGGDTGVSNGIWHLLSHSSHGFDEVRDAFFVEGASDKQDGAIGFEVVGLSDLSGLGCVLNPGVPCLCVDAVVDDGGFICTLGVSFEKTVGQALAHKYKIGDISNPSGQVR